MTCTCPGARAPGPPDPGLALALTIDKLANMILGSGRDETISAALGRKILNDTATFLERDLCRALDVFEKDHCVRSFLRAGAGGSA